MLIKSGIVFVGIIRLYCPSENDDKRNIDFKGAKIIKPVCTNNPGSPGWCMLEVFLSVGTEVSMLR